MKRKCNARSGLLLSLLVLAVFLLFPNKAAAAPVLIPKYLSVAFEGAEVEGQQRRRCLRGGDQRR